MSPFQRVLCALLAVGLLLSAVLLRYEIVSAGSGGSALAFKLDRWTGNVVIHR
jgi:hypothetical protein